MDGDIPGMAARKMHPHGIDVRRDGHDVLGHISEMFRQKID